VTNLILGNVEVWLAFKGREHPPFTPCRRFPLVTWRRHREGVEPLPFLRRRQTKPFFVGALVVSVLFDVVPPLFVFVGQTSFIGVLAGVAVAPGSPGPLGWTSRRVVFRLEQQQDVFRKKSHQVLHHDTLRGRVVSACATGWPAP
jgi:hypothetical protein